MSQARRVRRFGWLLISVGGASGCALPDYDLELGPRDAAQGGFASTGQSGETGRSSPRAGSAGITISAGGSLTSASGGNKNSSGVAGTGIGGEVSTESAAGSATGGASMFSSAGQPSQGGASATNISTSSGGAGNASGGHAETRSSNVSVGGAAGASLNGVAGHRTGGATGVNVSGAGSSSITGGSNSGGSASTSVTGGSNSGGNAGSGVSGAAVAGAPSTGGVAGAAGRSALPCPTGRGPDMVRVPEGYCIDKTEVTEGQYSAWIATDPQPIPANQIAECSWNDYYESAWLRGNASYPAVGVDWCDAVAFCKWANKRLCGAIGGGPADYYSDTENANASQWYNACSAHGAHVYPYGDTVVDTRCNAGKAGLDTVAPVGSFNRCTSSVVPYNELFDMSGNVWEWVDSCTGTEENDYCRVAGGSYEGSTDPRCGFPGYEIKNVWYYNVGIRCCAD